MWCCRRRLRTAAGGRPPGWPAGRRVSGGKLAGPLCGAVVAAAAHQRAGGWSVGWPSGWWVGARWLGGCVVWLPPLLAHVGLAAGGRVATHGLPTAAAAVAARARSGRRVGACCRLCWSLLLPVILQAGGDLGRAGGSMLPRLIRAAITSAGARESGSAGSRALVPLFLCCSAVPVAADARACVLAAARFFSWDRAGVGERVDGRRAGAPAVHLCRRLRARAGPQAAPNGQVLNSGGRLRHILGSCHFPHVLLEAGRQFSQGEAKRNVGARLSGWHPPAGGGGEAWTMASLVCWVERGIPPHGLGPHRAMASGRTLLHISRYVGLFFSHVRPVIARKAAPRA
ncbi:hypothetical protein I4F81_012671 [Pyropia yezoensis]|uniref:Uncharacterized protein n=1 Tax=Pyropia yezoensis TaxID=2788 RepID=A0ACC3CJC9_PYRYE|nr:hypothetical protein I4F81_012671 [Neopyropia yezoensis]